MAERVVVVDVWTASPVAVTARHRAVLDEEERRRAAGLAGDVAERFVLGRVLLRHAVAARWGCHPGDVALVARCARCGGPHGPVRVVPPHGPSGGGRRDAPCVSVTRAGPLVGVALCDAGPVGVDIEAPAAVGAAPVADVALSPGELVTHRGRSRRAGVRHLTRTWVRKEATLKAVGTGLDVDPASVELWVPPGRARGVDAACGESVAVADLAWGRGAVGAVAVVAPGLVHATAARGASRRRLVVRRYDGVSALDGRRS